MKYERLFKEQSFDKKKLKQEYLEFKKFVISNRLTESTTKLNEGLIPANLKSKFTFIKDIAKEIGVQVSDLIKLFLNKGIFILFAKIKWSIVELWKIVKAGFDLYKSLFEAWAKFIKENKITKGLIDKTTEKIKIVNDFFDKHPNIKKASGVLVAGLLIYIWLNATMVAHKDIDFDISTIIDAMLGKFDLADLFLSENGLIMLTNFIVGKVTGLTFPYPGSDIAKFTFAVIFTLAKKAKVKLEKQNLKESEKEKVKSELNDNFYKWFKGSKVIDSKGNPLICYHGSNTEFDNFDNSKIKIGWLGKGFYFTDDKKIAKTFGKKIMTCYINLKKPYIAESNDPSGLITELKNKYNLSLEHESDISIVLKKKGFDGLVYKHWDSTGTFYSVFNPNQIKSIYNDGSFDSNDKNIYS